MRTLDVEAVLAGKCWVVSALIARRTGTRAAEWPSTRRTIALPSLLGGGGVAGITGC